MEVKLIVLGKSWLMAFCLLSPAAIKRCDWFPEAFKIAPLRLIMSTSPKFPATYIMLPDTSLSLRASGNQSRVFMAPVNSWHCSEKHVIRSNQQITWNSCGSSFLELIIVNTLNCVKNFIHIIHWITTSLWGICAWHIINSIYQERTWGSEWCTCPSLKPGHSRGKIWTQVCLTQESMVLTTVPSKHFVPFIFLDAHKGFIRCGCYCPHFIDEAQRGETVLPKVAQLRHKAGPYDSRLKTYNILCNLLFLRPILKIYFFAVVENMKDKFAYLLKCTLQYC